MPNPIDLVESEDEIEYLCSSSEVEFVSHVKRPFDMTSDDGVVRVDLTQGDRKSIYRDKYAPGSIQVDNAMTARISRGIRPSVASTSTRPFKQQKTSHSRHSSLPHKRKRIPSTEPIIISDDDDEPQEYLPPNDYNQSIVHKRRRLRTDSPLRSDSEVLHDLLRTSHDNLATGAREDSDDEYDNRLHIDDPEIWKQDPVNAVAEKMSKIHVVHSPPVRSRHPLNVHANFLPPKKGKGRKLYIWDELESRLGSTRSSRSFDGKPKVTRRQDVTVKEFRKSAGAINQVVQHHGRIIVCSAASGGGQDEDEEEQNPYNKQATLVLWDDDLNPHVLEGHWAVKRNHTVYEKFYTVNNAAFDPHSSAFVSSATDKRVIVWSPNEEQELPENLICKCIKPDSARTHSYNAVPHDLAFMPHPQYSILAVAEQNITVHTRLQSRSALCLSVVPQESAHLHSAGAFSWGTGPTSQHLFASSEPKNDDPDKILENGHHKAFDIGRPRKELFAFDAIEGGDALTLNPLGGLVALFTRTESQNFLRLYDVERQVGRAQEKVILQPHSGLEVNCATFSPDSLYLAVARSDNRTHIYDTRMLERGVLHGFEHDGPARTSPGQGAFGVVHAEWTESSTNRLGLVTGGQDGFVRLWHPLRAGGEENGRVLGTANADIGHFSLGDRYKGEHELVIGDGDGGLYIFDGLGDF